MTVYSSQRPVKITANGDDEKYLYDHLTHFLNTVSFKIINSLSQEDKERFFKMITDHELIIAKLCGSSSVNSLIFLPESIKKGIKNKLNDEYKIWLEKQ